MTKPEPKEPNLPTINDTDVQTDLPPATDDSQETQEGGQYEPYMVTIGGNVYSVKARTSTEAGNKARELYDKDLKENK